MQNGTQISPVWRAYAEAAQRLGARLTAEALGPGRSGRRMDELARRLQRELDPMMEKAFASLPDPGALACFAGCDHCCRSLPVMVGPLEVFALVHRLSDMLLDDPGLALRIAAARAASPAAGADAGAAGAACAPSGLFPPCPLLGPGGLCTVYTSRPLACRGCVSGDAAACAACAETTLVPRSTAHQLGAAALMRGVCDALDGLGLVSTLVELRTGLALAIADETAERRWLRGADVFAGA